MNGNENVHRSISSDLGLFLLGISFAAWAVLMLLVAEVDYESLLFSPYYVSLVFSSIALTALGLVLVNIGAGVTLERGRNYVRLTSLAFLILNAVGFYQVYFNNGGITLPYTGKVTEEALFLAIVALLYSSYIAIYSLLILPFLSRNGKALLAISAVFSGIYIAYIIARTMINFLSMQNGHLLGLLPVGTIVPPAIQVVSPVFAFPGFTILSAIEPIPGLWLYMVSVGMNALMAYIFLSCASSIHKHSGSPSLGRVIKV